MNRIVSSLLLSLLLVPPVAAASPFAGTWTVTAMQPRQEVTIWLLQIREEGDKLQGKIAGALSPTTLEQIAVVDGHLQAVLRMNGMPYRLTILPPATEGTSRKFLGTLEARGRRDMVRMERSNLNQLDAQKAVVRGGPAVEALEKAVAIENAGEREAALRKLLQQYADQPAGVHVALGFLEMLADGNADAAQFRQAADQAIKLAAPYGRAMQMQVAGQAAEDLVQAERLLDVAVAYAQQARALQKETDSLEGQVRLLKTEARALRLAKKEAEAKQAEQRLAELDKRLDDDFLRGVLTFKTPPATASGKRVVLVELFTGAQCPPCVAADVAFLALTKSFKPNQAVFLQYHLHAPFPDPLTSPDAEKRATFYDVSGTPYLLLNGEGMQRPDEKGQAQGVGGLLQHAEERYAYVRKEIEDRLKKPPAADLKLAARRDKDAITANADYAMTGKPGEEVRLRFALVEEVVRYPGSNGQRLHHHVVRGFLGGAEGFPLKTATGKQSATVDLAELKKQLLTELENYNKIRKFPDAERPLDLHNLKVVAFLQDDKTKEVLNAVQADVP